MITRTIKNSIATSVYEEYFNGKNVKLIILGESVNSRSHINFTEYGSGSATDIVQYELPSTGSYVRGGISITGVTVKNATICSDPIHLYNTPITPNKFKMGGYAIISGSTIVSYDIFSNIRVIQDIDLTFMPNPKNGDNILINLGE